MTEPAYPVQYYCQLGEAFLNQGRADEAVALFRRAIELEPGFGPAHHNLGVVLEAKQEYHQAAECFRRAIALSPPYSEGHFNLAFVLRMTGDFPEAAHQYELALALRPGWIEAVSNLGETLLEVGQLDEAIRYAQTALARNPNLAETHVYLSRALLTAGNFDEGWQQYEWRWETGQLAMRDYGRPKWAGEPLEGRTLLIHAEQGLGDTFQFIRYASVLKRMGARILCECQPALVKLLAGCPSIDEVIGGGGELPEFDFRIPLVSIPRVLKTKVHTIPSDVPYLFADAALVEEWRRTLEGIRDRTSGVGGQRAGLMVGINWQGRPGVGGYRRRDVPLEFFEALADIEGVLLVSLQKGEVGSRWSENSRLIQNPKSKIQNSIFDLGEFDEMHGAFMDTAAIMMNLDLVITSDTAVPHLAGALGVPVWVALPFAADWRWLLNRIDSPWYPTMRLFRQKSPGDWEGVFEEIRQALVEELSADPV